MALYAYDGKRPRIGAGTYVHETAAIIGDVEIGEGCYIGPGASLRGDFGVIMVGSRSSIQDSCSLHTTLHAKCIVGEDVTVGHGAVLHGCTVGDRAVVGMMAVVTDNAVVGEDSIIAEGSVVRGGQTIPPRSMAAGIPAEVKRPLSDGQILLKNAGAKAYNELTRIYLEKLEKID